MNKVFLLGRAGKDAELQVSTSGISVCKVTLATSEKVKGEERTEWHRVTFFGKTAEIAGTYIKKGKQVLIEGRIQYGNYEKEGVKHYTTDIIADRLTLLGNKSEGGGEESAIESTEALPF